MSSQEIIKLIAAGIASICVLAGLFALFKGLKADGEIDLGGLVQGKVKTGSAGVIMLFFGTIIFCTLIAKGSSKSLVYGVGGVTYHGQESISVVDESDDLLLPESDDLILPPSKE